MTRLRIEVVYALPHAQDLVAIELEPPATARQAVEASGILRRHRELDRDGIVVGVFGKKVKSGQQLRDRDRVEILRPLAEDPKEGRRRRSRRLP